MPLLDEVAAYLQAQGLGTVGTDLFKSRLMDINTPAFCTALFETAGIGGQRVHDVAGINLARPGLDVLVRAATDGYAVAEARAVAIHAALAAVANQDLSGTRYLALDPLSPPQNVGMDAHNRVLIEIRFLVTKEPS